MKHEWRTRETIEVCHHCIHVSYNGAVRDEDASKYDREHAPRYERAFEIWHDEPIMVDSQADAHFSWSPCEYCGDILGGSRWYATVMQLHTIDDFND